MRKGLYNKSVNKSRLRQVCNFVTHAQVPVNYGKTADQNFEVRFLMNCQEQKLVSIAIIKIFHISEFLDRIIIEVSGQNTECQKKR